VGPERAHAELQWPNSVLVYDKMRRSDGQVMAGLRGLTLPIRRARWRLKPNGARDEVVVQISEDLHIPIMGAGRGGVHPPPRAWAPVLGGAYA